MLWLLGAGIVASLLKGLDWGRGAAAGDGAAAAPLATRREFSLPARVAARRTAGAALARGHRHGGRRVDLDRTARVSRGAVSQRELWWQFAFDASAPRMLRASLVSMLRAGCRRGVPPAAAATTGAVATVAAGAGARPPHPAWRGGRERSSLLLGDKTLLFSESGATFLMYGVAGRSWVAMGDPVGPVAEHAEMVWRFRELCDREGGWCAFYEVRPGNLAMYVDAGLSLTKIGEEARVALADFSLTGAARAPLRQAVSRAEREGAAFRILAGRTCRRCCRCCARYPTTGWPRSSASETGSRSDSSTNAICARSLRDRREGRQAGRRSRTSGPARTGRSSRST